MNLNSLDNFNNLKVQEDENENRMRSIIKNALYYYDQHQEEIIPLLRNVKYMEIIDNINNINQIILYDNDYNQLLKSSYEIAAIYNPNTSLWKWAWSISNLEKKYTYISRKILEYALNLDPVKENLLRSKLITSDIKISNELQLDIFLALSAYISRKSFILKIPIIYGDFKTGIIDGKQKKLYDYPSRFEFLNKANDKDNSDKVKPLIVFYYITEYKNKL